MEAQLPILEEALDGCRSLAQATWFLVEDSKYQRREQAFLITAGKAMGDHPDFEAMRFSSALPMEEDVFYMDSPYGPLDLGPLVVMRNCPVCDLPEVSFADLVHRRDGVRLKSFDRGHEQFDQSLVAEVSSLFGPAGAETEEGAAG